MSDRTPRRSRARIALGALAVLVVLAGALIATFDWNWLRGPLSSYLSGKFGRAFVIRGNLDGEFALRPLLVGTDVTLANTEWGSEPHLAKARKVAVRVDLPSLLGDGASLPELTLTDAMLLLERNADGHANWDFGKRNANVRIGRFSVDAGTVRFVDARRGIDVRSRVESAKATDDGQLTIRFDGNGVWENSDFAMKGTAMTPFATEVADRPYRLDVTARSGETSGTFNGVVIPTRAGGHIDGALTLQGADLSELDRFVPMEFSRTPAYRMSGQLHHENDTWSMRDMSAKVGSTDLAGSFEVKRTEQRTFVAADLASQSAYYKDMRALIGMSADDLRHAKVRPRPNANGQGSPSNTAKGSPDLRRIRLVDAKVHWKAKRFTVPDMRFDNLDAVADINAGVMKLHPLDFGIAGGHVVSTITVDAREKVPKGTAEVTVRDVQLSELVPALKPPSGSAGKASGRGRFAARGNSIADMLETTDGEIALMSAGGSSGSISSGLAKLDLGRAGKWLLRGDARAPVQCAVGDLLVHDGVMTMKRLVINTDSDTIVGHGTIDLVKKRYDLELDLQSKKPTLFGFSGPVLVDGPFDHPNVQRKGGPLVARVGAALGLGAVNPVAALLPLIDVGGETAANCRTLIHKTQSRIEALKTPESPPMRPEQARQ